MVIGWIANRNKNAKGERERDSVCEREKIKKINNSVPIPNNYKNVYFECFEWTKIPYTRDE